MMMSVQFVSPNLAIHLHDFGYSPSMIGAAYAIPAILYATSCPFMYLLTAKMQKRGIILIGFVMITIAMLMIGGSESIQMFEHNGSVPIFLGLMIIGLSLSMISIPVLPEMLDCIEEDEELAAMYDSQTLENVISGLFVSFQSLGESLGPVFGAYLTDHFNFTIGQEIYAGILVVFSLSYFFSCGNFAMFGRSRPPSTKLENKELLPTIPEAEREREVTGFSGKSSQNYKL